MQCQPQLVKSVSSNLSSERATVIKSGNFLGLFGYCKLQELLNLLLLTTITVLTVAHQFSRNSHSVEIALGQIDT